MYPAEFGYVRARGVDHALELLRSASDDDADVKLIAGGQSLLPMMKLRLAVPDGLIDIGGLPELSFTRLTGEALRIGAGTTYRALARDIPAGTALADALEVLADRQVRARGTVGGSLAHADPTADLPAVLLALDAEVRLSGPDGNRDVALDDFLHGVYHTDLAEEEILTEVAVPATARQASGQAYVKFEQPASHLALCGVGAVLRLDGPRVADARIAVTGVSGRAFRARSAERALIGGTASAAAIDEAARRVPKGVTPMSDIHASADYRRHLCTVIGHRALSLALRRASR